LGFTRSIRSAFGGHPEKEFGEGRRYPLSKTLIHDIRRHVAVLSRVDLGDYTFERRRSEYPQAKSDIIIYDAAGAAVLKGREMSGGESSFWPMS
jgi:hypothetical protein